MISEEMSNTNTPFHFLKLAPNENLNMNAIATDTNLLYKPYIESSCAPSYSGNCKTLKGILNQINSYKNEEENKTEYQKVCANKFHKERSDIIHNQNNSKVGCKSLLTANKLKSKAENQIDKLRHENNSLIKKLAKKKTKISLLKDEIAKIKKCQCTNSNVNLKEEIELLRMELEKKTDRINELYLENRLMRNDCLKLSQWRKGLKDILFLGSKEYNYINLEQLKSCTNMELNDEIYKLVEYLIEEKQALNKKYNKLLQLHNDMIENHGNYGAEYLYKVMDENEAIRNNLRFLCTKKT